MKGIVKFIMLVTLSFSSWLGHSQEVDGVVSSNALRVEFGLPGALDLSTNKAFRDFMTGIANTSLGYQYAFENSLSIELGAKYVLFRVNEFRNNFDLSGNVHIAGGYLKLGSDKYYSNWGINYGVKVGYAYNFADVNKCIDAKGQAGMTEGWLIEPNFTISYLVDERSSFTILNLTHMFNKFAFSPNFVCMEDFPAISPDTYRVRTTFFTFGFGYTYYF